MSLECAYYFLMYEYLKKTDMRAPLAWPSVVGCCISHKLLLLHFKSWASKSNSNEMFHEGFLSFWPSFSLSVLKCSLYSSVRLGCIKTERNFVSYSRTLWVIVWVYVCESVFKRVNGL